MPGVIYQFEDVGDDLPRPPMAAMRAFLAAGIVLSPRGWSALSPELRRGFVQAGSAPFVDVVAVQAGVRGTPVSEVRLVPRIVDPDPNRVPDSLASALGPQARVTPQRWSQLRPIDRYVLTTLALNTRLLFRALREIMPEDTATEQPWKAAVAHVEVAMRGDSLDRLRSSRHLDGRAFMLARVAGVRAARRAQETFDLRSEKTVGSIELDWAPADQPGRVIWQAHVTLADMTVEHDASVVIEKASIVEEPWRVGGDQREQPTTLFSAKELRQSLAAHGSKPRMDDPGSTAARMQNPVSVPPAQTSRSSPPTAADSSAALPVVHTPPTNPAPERDQSLTQSNVIVYALFGMLAIMLLALVGIILALASMRH